ncbi:MAG: KamA family protein [Bacteroidales bacterium]
MDIRNKISKITIPPVSYKLCIQLLDENPDLATIIKSSKTHEEADQRLKKLILDWFSEGHEYAASVAKRTIKDRLRPDKISWQEMAAIRIYDYVANAGKEYENLNKRIKVSVNDPFAIVWLAYHKRKGGGRPEFFLDMIHLFRQFSGREERTIPSVDIINEWMERYPAGTSGAMVKNRNSNRKHIINVLIKLIEKGETGTPEYTFSQDMTREQKEEKMNEWWDDYKFHLHFAIRSPGMLNEMLGYSLDTDTVDLLRQARKAGIPFFVNPYYLSLLNAENEDGVMYADQTIREYIIYSKELIDEYGKIEAWEKEDKVEPGKPNAAGWLLPNEINIHRRYPEVAILIPDTMGRACGGLCVSCQRMYDFQRGNLNFNLETLKPDECWEDKLDMLMEYFENDSQLRDILVTGGDALMSSDRSLKVILDAVYKMAVRKREFNKNRPDGEKYAEVLRVRLGTRLPVYLPQRVTENLVGILKEFREKASEAGIRQFIIQTHFISPAEITPESRKAVRMLLDAGWIVTNQMVFTAAGSRRGHTAKLRKDLNDIGVLTYYTFTVKGYMENYRNFATNARSVMEMTEEKYPGIIPPHKLDQILDDLLYGEGDLIDKIKKVQSENNVPFIATDRNIVNLPGIGKSMTYRVVGLTRRGRRILEFEHDTARKHSPSVNEHGKIYIIESKPIIKYLKQLEKMGEEIEEYSSVWGYSLGVTEPRAKIFEYPEFDFGVTGTVTNVG